MLPTPVFRPPGRNARLDCRVANSYRQKNFCQRFEARRAGHPDVYPATPDMYPYRRTTARRHIHNVVIRSRAGRVWPQRGARFRAYADESPHRKVWLTTEAQLRRPVSMRASMACRDLDTQAGALGTMRAKKRLAEKLGN